jgi:hypothetical protein
MDEQQLDETIVRYNLQAGQVYANGWVDGVNVNEIRNSRGL